MSETNPAQSRFQVIPVASAPFPHKCIVCGSVDRDLVDFGVTTEYDGAVLFCTDCMAEGALKIGFVSGVTYHQALNMTDRVTANLDRAVALITQFAGDLNDTVDDLIIRIDGSLTSESSSDGASADSESQSDSPVTDAKGQASSGTDGQGAGVNFDEGPFSVPSSTSDVKRKSA